MDELGAVVLVLFAVAAAGVINGYSWLMSNAAVVSPSAIVAVITSAAAAGHRRRDLLHKLGPLYTATQDICRRGLNPQGSLHASSEVAEWWRLVRELSPLLGKRGQRLLRSLHNDLGIVIRPANLDLVEPSEVKQRQDQVIEAQKRIAQARELITTDRDILITIWPEFLDPVRRAIRRPDKESGLST